MNAFQMYQASLAQQQQQHGQTYLPPPHALPSSGSQEFFGPPAIIPPNRDSTDPALSSASSDTASDHTNMFPGQQDFKATVPTILETSQAGSRAGIVSNLQAAGYPVSGSVMSCATNPEDSVFGHPQFAHFDGAAFVLPQDFGDFDHSFHNMSDGMDTLSYSPYVQTSAPSVQNISRSESLSASESPNNMPSLTSAYTHQEWSDDRKMSLPVDSPLESVDPIPHSQSMSSDATPTWQSAQLMDHPLVLQQGFYSHQNPSAPSLSPRDQSEFASPGELDLPNEAFARRNSSASALADSMSTVDITTQQSADSNASQPAHPSSIAARRQKNRPANLGPAALRSASYSVGMPGSPGANQAAAPDQALRRIRSSVANLGRVSKVAASGQRSPLNYSFAEATASPKYARHASNYSVSTVSSGPLSATSNSLVPPTPQTPSDFARFPSWQSHGVVKTYPPNGDMNGSAYAGESFHNGLYLNVSSPPDTPSDADHFAQFRAHNCARQQALYHDTPPQSAPASQLAFAPTSIVPQSQSMTQSMSGDKSSHIRRPSLPDGSFNLDSQPMWPAVPMFNNTGDLQMSNPMQFNAQNIPQFTPQPIHPTMHGYPGSLSESLVKNEFAVHHYSPPQGASSTPSPPKSDSLPKLYHFANTGPSDFECSTASKV
jgi:hypothetical protein